MFKSTHEILEKFCGLSEFLCSFASEDFTPLSSGRIDQEFCNLFLDLYIPISSCLLSSLDIKAGVKVASEQRIASLT